MSDSTPTPLPAGPQPTPPKPPGPRLRPLKALFAGMGCLLLALASALVWAAFTESGSRWLLGQIPGLALQGWHGRLVGPDIGWQTLSWKGSAGELRLDGAEIRGWHWIWRPHENAWLGLAVERIDAAAVTWQSGPPAPATGPAGTKSSPSLALPVSLDVGRLAVARLAVNEAPVLTPLELGIHLGSQQGSWHELSDIHIGTDRVEAQGHFGIASQGELAQLKVDSQLSLRNAGSAPMWTGDISAQGLAGDLKLKAHLAGAPRPGHGVPAAELQAELHPFRAWPLSDAQLSTLNLNLNDLLGSAPQTRLSGQLLLHSDGLNQDAQARLRLDNSAAGPWNEQRLPVRHLELLASGTPEPLQLLKLDRLRIDWGSAARPGGMLEGHGDYRETGGQGVVALALSLTGMKPSALEASLPAMALSGPVKLRLQGLPTPASWRGPAKEEHRALQLLPTSAAPSASASGVSADVELDVHGPMDSPSGQAIEARLSVRSHLSPDQVEVQEWLAQAGPAVAQGHGRLDHDAKTSTWQGLVHAELTHFDPALWLPHDPKAAWARGPNNLNMAMDGHASLPDSAVATPAPNARTGLSPSLAERWLGKLIGQAQIDLTHSEWAGLPVGTQLTLVADAEGVQVEGNAHAASNFLEGSARMSANQGTLEHSWLSVTAADLPRLRRWLEPLAIWPTLEPFWPLEGRAEAALNLDGPMKALNWHGYAQVDGWRSQRLGVGQAGMQTQGVLDPQQPMSLTLSLKDVNLDQARLRQGRVQVEGSLAQHHVTADLDSTLIPPPWLEQIAQAHLGTGTRLQAELTGQWRAEDAQQQIGSGRWSLGAGQFQLGASDGSGQPWLRAQDLSLVLSLGGGRGLYAAEAAPGSVLTPVNQLSWTQATWQTATESAKAQIDLEARVSPSAVAPWLARFQPELGWQGDLALAGRVSLHLGESLKLDAEISRSLGDLSLTDNSRLSEARQQVLGLNELQVRVQAENGVWTLVHALDGQQVGELSVLASLQAPPDALMPAETAALTGRIHVQVNSLAAWAPWIPAGWRVAGGLNSSVALGGSLSHPEITGRLDGHDLQIRNVLQGVHWSDGVIAVILEGDKARIEQFHFHGGDGQLSLQGQGQLGDNPHAEISLKAESFRLLSRVDRSLSTSGDMSLGWKRGAGADIDGTLRVDEGLVDFSKSDAPGLDDDVQILSLPAAQQPEPSRPEPAPKPSAPPQPTAARTSQALRLSLNVDLGERLRLKGHGLDTRLRGKLKITNPDSKIKVVGDVTAVQGTYAAYSQKLDVERGLIVFNGPADDPRLDIFAIRSNMDIKVGVLVTGTALNPRVRLASEPDMSEPDKLSWLLLGRAPESLGQADTALVQRTALALLAGDNQGSSNFLLDNLAQTDISVRQDSVGDKTNRVVSVGRQLSRHWYVSYENSDARSNGIWQLTYRLAQRLTVRASAGAEHAIDLIWTWRWD